MNEAAILKNKVHQEQMEKSVQNYEFICENEGFRYYKDAHSGRQYCLDSASFWYILNEEKGAYEPMASNLVTEKQTDKPRLKQERTQPILRNVERFGIKFDQHGKPVFPVNEKGLFILPKDEKGSPFFPVDDRSVPIFPWSNEKGAPTFPVDDTDEPIFPRNDQNKPIVPVDENGQPIFPVDKSGIFIFPVDESNCPIPALTVYGTRVVPKDEFGNPVIPRDRDGKALIHIASDGVTPLAMSEWKQWKKYYKEQAQARAFYQQRQQQTVAAEPVAGIAMGAVNYSAVNSMFHPLNLEQQSAYFAADMEMLQRVRRVRPEDVDLPGQMVGQNVANEQNAKLAANGQTLLEDREEKRKKLLKAQLKSAKMAVPPPAAQNVNKASEEHKKNGVQQQKKDEQPKKEAEKKQPQQQQQQVAEKKGNAKETSGESDKRGRGSAVSGEGSTKSTTNRKRSRETSRKRSSETSTESSVDRDKRTRHPTRSRSAKRSRRVASSSSSSSSSRSRSRSSRSYRRSAKRLPSRDRRSRRRSSSNSTRTSSSSSVSSSSRYSSSERSHSKSRSGASDRDEEEERIRDRIIARTLSTSTATQAKPPPHMDAVVVVEEEEAMEYGPKPPESLEHSSHNSDMEMSDEDNSEPNKPPQQHEEEEEAVSSEKAPHQRICLKRHQSVESVHSVPHYLRALIEVVGSEDVPLDLSQEMLHTDLVFENIRKALTECCVRFFLSQLSKDRVKYTDSYMNYSTFFKEGVVTEQSNTTKEEIAQLLLFESSNFRPGTLTTLSEYVERMQTDQKTIYYIYAPSRQLAETSPYFELFKNKYEVLFLSDPADELVFLSMPQFRMKTLQSLEKWTKEEGLSVDSDKELSADLMRDSNKKEFLGWLRQSLGTVRVSDIKPSGRQSEHPFMITISADMGAARHMLRITEIKEMEHLVMLRPVLHVNLSHPVVTGLICLKRQNSELASEIAVQVYENALCTAGLLKDTSKMVGRLNKIFAELMKLNVEKSSILTQ